MNKNNNTVPVEEKSSQKYAYDRTGTVLETSRFIENNWQKVVAAIILIVSGLWFYNEYRINNMIRAEQASQSFSRASSLLKSIILVDTSEDQSDILSRYLDEIELLTEDYGDTPYGQMAEGLKSVFTVSRASESSQSLSIDVDELKQDLINLDYTFESKPVEKISSELKLLMYGRYLVDSSITEQKTMGLAYLKSVIEKGDFFPVEASLTYYLSVRNNKEKLEELHSYLNQLVVRYPQMEEQLIEKFSKLGIKPEFLS